MSPPGRSPRAWTAAAARHRRPAAEPVSVLAVDDQAAFRRALRELIGATAGFELVGEAASGPEGIAMARELAPDLVLVDVRMPDMDGLETARRLAAEQTPSVVVLISLEPTTEDPEAVGAAAHVLKQDLSTATLRELWDAHDPARSRR
ncbi:MAG TPA: response regulator transcription factor [Capillimicrobium sp.]|nr:response regulator transcription factor [Capillimicrobium sp.]